jgi:hypothetical protein
MLRQQPLMNQVRRETRPNSVNHLLRSLTVGFFTGIVCVPFAYGADSLTYITYKGGYGVRLSGISRDGKIVFGSAKDGYWNAATFDGDWHFLKTGANGDTNMDDGLTAYGTSRYGLSGWKLGKGRKVVTLPLQGYQLTGSSEDASTILATVYGGNDLIWANDQAKAVPIPSGYDSVHVNGISGDGKTWVGSGTINLSPIKPEYLVQGLTWQDGVATLYSDPDFDIEAFDGISPNGKILFGVGSAKSDPMKAERTVVIKGGLTKEYGRPGGLLYDCNIKQISADGTVAIGGGHGLTGHDYTSGFATIWDADGNFCDAGLLLKTMGLLSYRPNGLRLNGVSADGQTIVGDYSFGNDTKSFVFNLQKGNWPYLLNRTYLTEIIQGDQPFFKFSIARPAPKGGIKLTLSSSSDRISVPATVLIPSGQTSAQIRFRTAAPRPGVDVPEGVTITVGGPVNTETCKTAVFPLDLVMPRNVTYKGGLPASLWAMPNQMQFSYPVVLSVKSSNPDVLWTDSDFIIPANSSNAYLPLKSVSVTKKTSVRLTLKRGAIRLSRS